MIRSCTLRVALTVIAASTSSAAWGQSAFYGPSVLPPSVAPANYFSGYPAPYVAGYPNAAGANTGRGWYPGAPAMEGADAGWPTSDGPTALADGGCEAAGGCCGECGDCCLPCWYFGAAGLVFTRNRPRFGQLSFDDTDPVGQVLSTYNGLGQWDGGVQLQVGRYLGDCHALELTYWGIYPSEQTSTVLASSLVGNLNTVFDMRPLNIGANNVNDLYDAAAAHREQRDYEVHNVELNLLGGNVPWWECTASRLTWLAGVRYLRFTDVFQYASADVDPVFGNDPANEAYYDIDVRNNLFGFQLGGRLDWYWTDRLALYVAPKFGIYGNQIDHTSRIYNNVDGVAVVGPGNPLAGQAFDINSDRTMTSFLGEIDLGLNYRFSTRWSGVLGYRVVAVSNVALATDQIPGNFADLPGVADVDAVATLILHGGYAGLQFAW